MNINRRDLLMYNAMVKAIEQKMVRVAINFGVLNKVGSPVYNPWENLLPILSPLILGLVMMFMSGIIGGMVIMLLGLMLYGMFFKTVVSAILENRTVAYITKNYEQWQTIWDMGGITVLSTLYANVGCASPEGDWKQFVALNISDLMVEEDDSDMPNPKGMFTSLDDDPDKNTSADKGIDL